MVALGWFRRRTERREGSFTEAVISGLEIEASGAIQDGRAVAQAEACIGLWSRALSVATVKPMRGTLAPVTPDVLGIIGRDLATSGSSVWKISVDGGNVFLTPAASWDLTGPADEPGWRYHLHEQGPSGSTSEYRPSDSVLHFRINVEARAPWRGVSPLRRAASTADLAVAIEAAIRAEAGIWAMRMVPTGDVNFESWRKQADVLKARKGGMAFAAGGLGLSGTGAASVIKTTPDPAASVVQVRQDLGNDIKGAFGIPAVLLGERGDGSARREAWRLFGVTVGEHLAALVQTELRRKLEPTATVNMDRLRTADLDGRTRAVDRLVKAGVSLAEARTIAGL